jgi:hypothetical protein
MGETYFYVPIQYEKELTQEIDLAINQGKTTIVTGVYQTGNFVEGYSTVRNRDVLGRITNIPNSVVNGFTNETKYLIGFTIKSRIKVENPEVYDYFNSLEGCKEFSNAREYKEFINTLTT